MMTPPPATSYRARVSEPAAGELASPARLHPGAGWRPGARRGPGPWLALLVGVPQVVGTVLAAHNQLDRRHLGSLGLLLLATSALALVAREHAPVATLAVAGGATAVYYGLGYPYGPAFLALAFATVGAVRRGRRHPALAVLGGAFVVFAGVERAVTGEWPPLPRAVATLGWLAALLGIAELVRARAEQVTEARRRAEEERRRRASEERLLLARELHDVLAHNVSLINVQASTALHLFDEDPQRARTALTAIKAASRETLQELRATLGALRAEGEAAPRSPTAGLDRLEDLAAQTTAVGPAVAVRRRGTPRPLPPSVELAAYRIVQEALTNARRHSGARSVTVLLDYAADALEVQVLDDGRGAPASALEAGHGLRGMRERAEALGGSLTAGPAGPAGTGGFAVAVRLPVASVEEPR
jgi:signal transduction histidine kinase